MKVQFGKPLPIGLFQAI